MKSIVIVCLLLTLSACTANYQIIRHDHVPLATTDTYYVATPANGRYNEIRYDNSGEMTRDILISGLVKRGIRATGGLSGTKDAAMADAKTQQCNRLVYSTILHWEDRATEWSGIRDKAKVAIDIIDTESGKTLDNTVLDLTGTWWTLGGLHPQDLVEEASEDYFNQLFGEAGHSD